MNKYNYLIVGILLLGLGGCANSNIKSSVNDGKSYSSQTSILDNSKIDELIDEAKNKIPSLKKVLNEIYSDIEVSKEGSNTLVYTYTYLKYVNQKIDVTSLKSTLAKQIEPMMTEVGTSIPDFKVKFVYLNSDKSELGNITITQEDINNIQEDLKTEENVGKI